MTFVARRSLHKRSSSPAKAGDPVRRAFSIPSLAPLEYWVARSSRAMTSEKNCVLVLIRHSFAISPRAARVFLNITCPPEDRGRRECRAHDAPAAWWAEKNSHTSEVTTVTPKNARHSPRNGFNGFLRALPGDRACCHRRRRDAEHRHQLDASVEASEPHDFAVRLPRPRLKRDQRPPHPAPRS